jgi:hypothetical protein
MDVFDQDPFVMWKRLPALLCREMFTILAVKTLALTFNFGGA